MRVPIGEATTNGLLLTVSVLLNLRELVPGGESMYISFGVLLTVGFAGRTLDEVGESLGKLLRLGESETLLEGLLSMVRVEAAVTVSKMLTDQFREADTEADWLQVAELLTVVVILSVTEGSLVWLSLEVSEVEVVRLRDTEEEVIDAVDVSVELALSLAVVEGLIEVLPLVVFVALGVSLGLKVTLEVPVGV